MALARRFALAAFLAAALCASAAEPMGAAAPSKPPQRMLFVGNSLTLYNGGVHTHVRALAQAADKWNAPYYEVDVLATPGAFLHQHRRPLAEKLLVGLPWDLVVLQGESTEPMATDEFKALRFQLAARELDRLVRESRSRSVLFMTWAYRDKPEMEPLLVEAYRKAGRELGVLVVPVGLAFRSARADAPGIPLYEPDGRHPSPEGTYLAACTFYASLYGKSPQGVTYIGQLRREDAEALQKAAWAAAKEFHGG